MQGPLNGAPRPSAHTSPTRTRSECTTKSGYTDKQSIGARAEPAASLGLGAGCGDWATRTRGSGNCRSRRIRRPTGGRPAHAGPCSRGSHLRGSAGGVRRSGPRGRRRGRFSRRGGRAGLPGRPPRSFRLSSAPDPHHLCRHIGAVGTVYPTYFDCRLHNGALLETATAGVAGYAHARGLRRCRASTARTTPRWHRPTEPSLRAATSRGWLRSARAAPTGASAWTWRTTALKTARRWSRSSDSWRRCCTRIGGGSRWGVGVPMKTREPPRASTTTARSPPRPTGCSCSPGGRTGLVPPLVRSRHSP